jgi:hypothetical protein
VQLEQQPIVRLRTATLRFSDAQTERIWAIVSAHQTGLSIRKIAGATGLTPVKSAKLLNAPEVQEIANSCIRKGVRPSGTPNPTEAPHPR